MDLSVFVSFDDRLFLWKICICAFFYCRWNFSWEKIEKVNNKVSKTRQNKMSKSMIEAESETRPIDIVAGKKGMNVPDGWK